MLEEVHESGNAEGYVRKKLEQGERVMGFGHRVYRVRDPRAAILSTAAKLFYEADGDIEFFQTVQECEEIASNILAEHKPDRRLETNVEYYTAALLHGVGIPRDLFTAIFSVSRVGVWMAYALEQLADNRLIRPRSRFVGSTGRTWIPPEVRWVTESTGIKLMKGSSSWVLHGTIQLKLLSFSRPAGSP
jgi:citrate synthase